MVASTGPTSDVEQRVAHRQALRQLAEWRALLPARRDALAQLEDEVLALQAAHDRLAAEDRRLVAEALRLTAARGGPDHLYGTAMLPGPGSVPGLQAVVERRETSAERAHAAQLAVDARAAAAARLRALNAGLVADIRARAQELGVALEPGELPDPPPAAPPLPSPYTLGPTGAPAPDPAMAPLRGRLDALRDRLG